MYSTQVPVRCLFPDSTDPSTQDASPFSIGDIMKSVGLPVQENQDRVSQKDNTVQMSVDVPKVAHDGIRSLQTSTGTSHQGAQTKHFLHNQVIRGTEKSSGRSAKVLTSNPFLSFLDRPSLLDDTNGCGTPILSVPLTLQHLKSCPEMSPGLPSTVQQYSFLSTRVQPREPVTSTSPRSVSAPSPTSDISEDQIDVESTSPNGSTTSSGFGSNSSPSPSFNGSPSTLPIEVPANPRTAYNEKQTSRLKQVFQENRYPDSELYEELSEELNIPIQRLRVWFQNRRARNKKNVPDPRMMNYPPHVSAMMSSAPGYGYMAPSPMIQSLYQYPVSPASMYPMYPPNMYPGYSYPIHYQH